MSKSDDGFSDLIEALTIFRKYAGMTYSPTHCEHEVLMICGVDLGDVSEDDKERLDSLGFFVSDEYGEEAFQSFRFGSA